MPPVEWQTALIAAPLAILITLLELVTSKYKRTLFTLPGIWQFWFYGLIYGAIAGLLGFVVEYLITNKILTMQGPAIDQAWVRGVIIGLTTKALMKTTFFNVGSGLNPTPIGISTAVQLFEPWLLEDIELANWNGVRRAIEPHALAHANLADVKLRIEDNVPSHLSPEMKALILSETSRATTVTKALETYLIYAGRSTLRRVFPL